MPMWQTLVGCAVPPFCGPEQRATTITPSCKLGAHHESVADGLVAAQQHRQDDQHAEEGEYAKCDGDLAQNLRTSGVRLYMLPSSVAQLLRRCSAA
jgi:hypothetical protein